MSTQGLVPLGLPVGASSTPAEGLPPRDAQSVSVEGVTREEALPCGAESQGSKAPHTWPHIRLRTPRCGLGPVPWSSDRSPDVREPRCGGCPGRNPGVRSTRARGVVPGRGDEGDWTPCPGAQRPSSERLLGVVEPP